MPTDRRRGLTFAAVRRIGLAFPGAEESTSYGTPALKVKGKLFARLKEDGRTLVIMASFLDREALMELDGETFFLTDHYRPYPCVLVRLSTVGQRRLKDVLEQSWRRVAPKALVGAFDPGRPRRKGGE